MEGSEVFEPPKPTRETLVALFGEPPWALHVDDFGAVPDEDTDLVGMLIWRGRLFKATGVMEVLP